MGLKLEKHVRLEGKMTCLTGLRIGGSKDDIQIGGADSPIIRDPVTKLPYVPGSSIKGKLRSLLEYKYDRVPPNGEPCGCAQENCLVCRVFGPHKRAVHALGPSRIIVRDATLCVDSEERLRKLQQDGLLYAEVKTENIIDRRTGVAATGGLRSQERVPAGTVFDFRISLRVFRGDNQEQLVAFVSEGLQMLESEYLGGSGTRGYGQVKLDYQVHQ